MSKRKASGYQQKLLRSYLLFMLVMVVFSTAYWSVQMLRERSNSIKNHLSLLAEQSNSVIDATFAQLKSVLYLHLENELIEQVLTAEYGAEAAASQYLYYLSQGILQQNPDLLSVCFISPSGTLYADGNQEMSPEEIAHIVACASRRHGIPYIDTPRADLTDRGRVKVVAIAKELISLKSGRGIGYIVTTLDFSKLARKIDDSLADGGYVMVYSADDQLQYSSNTHYALMRSVDAELRRNYIDKGRDIPEFCYLSGLKLFVYGAENRYTGWRILKFGTGKDITLSFVAQIALFISISTVCFCFVALLATRVSRRFSQNVNLLRGVLRGPASAALAKIPVASVRDDEIGDLIVCYNQMVDHLNQSIEKEYAATIRAQAMQIKMLHYQINPHFLYNCLNLISSLAIIRSAPDISHVAHILGEMFHYSIEGGDIVRIRDEMNHILDYLEIQRIRFPDKFQVEYDIDSPLLDMPCMKFILQPIVENCFSHGFLPMVGDQERIMRIRIVREGACIAFSVLDNGRGIDRETLNGIRAHLYQNADEVQAQHGFIGLWNIHKRLETYYGKPHGLTIESEPGKFTRVTLRIPLRPEKE